MSDGYEDRGEEDLLYLPKKQISELDPQYKKAISKWQDDREYVLGYKIRSKNTFVIKGIHIKH